jgi:hypothetical protein
MSAYKQPPKLLSREARTHALQQRVHALALIAANPNAFAPETTVKLAERSNILASGYRANVETLFGVIVENNLSSVTLSPKPQVVTPE